MALQSFLLVPPMGAGYFHAKFQLRSPPSWPPNGQQFENFALNYHFGRPKSGHCASLTRQTAKQTAPNDAERRETPACKVWWLWSGRIIGGVIHGGEKRRPGHFWA